MRLAAELRLPLVTFIDTPGAYPGIGAEERGQAEAIARSTECCLRLVAGYYDGIRQRGLGVNHAHSTPAATR